MYLGNIRRITRFAFDHHSCSIDKRNVIQIATVAYSFNTHDMRNELAPCSK